MKYTYNDLVKIIEDNGIELEKSYNVEVRPDYDAESPREWDNIGIIYARNSKHLSNEWIHNEKPSEDEYYIYPISTYEHGTVHFVMDTPSDPWDSWCDARILIPKSAVKDAHEAYNIAKSEVDLLDKWSNDEVYFVCITDHFGDVVDSCGGFYTVEEVLEQLDYKQYGLDDDDIRKAWNHE